MGGSAFARDSRVERLPSPALTPMLLSHPQRARVKISRGRRQAARRRNPEPDACIE
jgi:hypothetical protein